MQIGALPSLGETLTTLKASIGLTWVLHLSPAKLKSTSTPSPLTPAMDPATTRCPSSRWPPAQGLSWTWPTQRKSAGLRKGKVAPSESGWPTFAKDAIAFHISWVPSSLRWRYNYYHRKGAPYIPHPTQIQSIVWTPYPLGITHSQSHGYYLIPIPSFDIDTPAFNRRTKSAVQEESCAQRRSSWSFHLALSPAPASMETSRKKCRISLPAKISLVLKIWPKNTTNGRRRFPRTWSSTLQLQISVSLD